MMNCLRDSLFVVEDNSADFRVLKRILKQMNIMTPINRVETGEEALQRLSPIVNDQDDSAVCYPSIIILDLNLPGTDGREVLVQLKENKELAKVPIVVFTTSSDPNDIDFCYQHGASRYIIKPVDMEQLKDKLQKFVDYWLGVSTPPTFVM